MIIQDYPQRMILHERLFGISTARFLIFMVRCNCKLLSFFAKSIKKPLKDYIQGGRLDLTLR